MGYAYTTVALNAGWAELPVSDYDRNDGVVIGELAFVCGPTRFMKRFGR